MTNLEKYLDQVIEQRPVPDDLPMEPERPAPPDMLRAVHSRWYIAALIFVLVNALALPAIWLLVQPRYVVTGAIHVVPLLRSILTGEPDRGDIYDFASYMNTQATTIMSAHVLEYVADDLVGRDLSFFKEDSSDPVARLKRRLKISSVRKNPVEILKAAVANGTISAGPQRGTELITVTVKSRNDAEARLIVDSFLRNYQNLYGAGSAERTNETLSRLREEESTLAKTISQQHADIVRLTEQFGTTALDSRQEMEMQRQAALWTELIRLEARRIGVEASIAALEQAGDSNVPPEQLMAARKEYTNADSMVQELTKDIVEMKRDMLIAKQMLVSGNPELVRKEQLLTAFEENLKEKEEQLSREFDEQVAGRTNVANQQRLKALAIEREQIDNHDKKLRAALNVQDTTTRQVGQASVNLQDLQFRMSLNQELHDQIMRRVKNIEMEMQRDPRVQVASWADVTSIEDKRMKYSSVAIFVGLGAGLALAVLRDRLDKTLHTPDDLTRQLGLPVIGTTTSSHTVKAALFTEQLAGDYQTIRTNLSLLTTGGMPKKLAVSSPGVREGKTTFAVNLATSLAKSGKKVLLIDGDLRKPDIGHMLSIVNGSPGLQDVLMGGNAGQAIHVIASTGLHVLPANPRSPADAYELLTSMVAAEQVDRLARQYDHLVVDTPPALAFPDALVWAKLTDAVVLISFAGQTTAPELKEVRERFARIRAQVLGAVLSNVPVERSMYRSSHAYRTPGSQAKYRRRMAKRLLLLTPSKETSVSGASGTGADDGNV